MLARYKNHLRSAGLSEGTIKQRVGHLKALTRRKGNPLDLQTVDLEAELARMRERGHAAETRKSVRGSYRAYYKWAHQSGLIEADPAVSLRPIRIPVTVPRVAPDVDLQYALITATVHEKAMIILARFACLRLSEVAGLSTKHREGDRLRITGKGDKQRIVYLNDEALHALLDLERLQGSGYYFPGRFGGHMHPSSMNKIIARKTGWNPHSLRHAGATAAYRATKDLRSVQLMLGHASMATTQRYLQPDDEGLRAVAQGTGFKATMSVFPRTTLAA